MAKVVFSLYSTSSCHLCEEAENLLLVLFQTPGLLPPLIAPDDENAAGVAVDVIDISDDDNLVARYGQRIPVLAWQDKAGATHELAWPFEPEQVVRFIRNAVKAA